MKTRDITTTCRTLFALAFMFIAAHGARAQDSLHHYVAVSGNDINSCSRDAPCRTFAGAIAKTAAGGEITALDTGQYGNVVIGKSLTLVGAPGVSAMVNDTNSATAIFISVGAPAVVVLRNLRINSFAPPTYPSVYDGIHFQGAGELNIQGCVIRGWAYGIYVSALSINDPSPFHLSVDDTVVSDCYRAGINLFTSGTQSIQASVEHCRLQNNNIGLSSTSSSAVSSTTAVRDTVASGNTKGFFNAYTQLNIANCEASNNYTGIESTGGTVRVSSSVVTNNSNVGFLNGGGTFQSLGDNFVRGNGQNVQGTITAISGT